ncbi:MAG: hypothetical protein O7H41_12695 [Planctomycetota bacterium]|nr:hypothetical protein [Planctomycetota bacterium]
MIRFRDLFKRDEKPDGAPRKSEGRTERMTREAPSNDVDRTEFMRTYPSRSDDPLNSPKGKIRGKSTHKTPRKAAKSRSTRMSRDVSDALEEVLEEEGLLGPVNAGIPRDVDHDDEDEEWGITLDEVLEKYSVGGEEEAVTEVLSGDQVESLRELLKDEKPKIRSSRRRKRSRG